MEESLRGGEYFQRRVQATPGNSDSADMCVCTRMWSLRKWWANGLKTLPQSNSIIAQMGKLRPGKLRQQIRNRTEMRPQSSCFCCSMSHHAILWEIISQLKTLYHYPKWPCQESSVCRSSSWNQWAISGPREAPLSTPAVNRVGRRDRGWRCCWDEGSCPVFAVSDLL